MKKQLGLGMVAAVIGAAGGVAQAANYNGDLLVGFSKLSGNDVVYDLGSATSITNGQIWNLSALLSSSSLNVTNVNWGVIGDKTGTPRLAWTTTSGPASIPPGLGNNAAWAALDTPTKSIYQFFASAGAGQSLSIAATDDNSWNQQTISGGLATQYLNAYENPNVQGLTSASLFRVSANGATPALAGTFTLGFNGVLTFSTAAPSLPPTPVIRIMRNGNLNSISFASTGGATYSLCLTNAAGLATPIANWPTLPGTLSGDGTIKTFNDTSVDPNRFYGVKAQ